MAGCLRQLGVKTKFISSLRTTDFIKKNPVTLKVKTTCEFCIKIKKVI